MGARLVPFAGWEMPVQYGGILDEHRAVRERAGLFDVSHMGEVEVLGPDAFDFLLGIVSNDLQRCAVGQAQYNLMCQVDGGVVDDIIVYRLAEDHFFICLNAGNTSKDIAWLQQHATGRNCSVRDLSAAFAQLAVQGPLALEIAARVLPSVVDLPRRFTFGVDSFAGEECIVSRTGYTGEDGVEIYLPNSIARPLAEALIAAGRDQGLVWCGLGARDSLRLEAGYPLYGHEISESLDPLSAGLGWAVKLTKQADFIGKQALQTRQAEGIVQRVVFFKLDNRRIAREGTPILDQSGRQVGRVLSGSLSPILGQAIGSALIDASVGQDLYVDLRGNKIALVVAKPPLHKFPA
ncbi:MAG: glycine cleavage system aminomethyltransferase GcvT [Verrucomicrobia bacterium]|nr:glycine cleavage system aminomethyltransferase GcvT [Verrucomicrobiota bacterium]